MTEGLAIAVGTVLALRAAAGLGWLTWLARPSTRVGNAKTVGAVLLVFGALIFLLNVAPLSGAAQELLELFAVMLVTPVLARVAAPVAALPTGLCLVGVGIYTAMVWACQYTLHEWVGCAALGAAWLGAEALLPSWLIRRGWWRAAFLAGACLDERWSGNRAAGGVVNALRALFYCREGADRPGRAWEAGWLEGRDLPAEPLGPMLMSRGLLAAARGDREGAAVWLRAIPGLSPEQASAACRRMAVEWLCAHAATEGRWEEALAFAQAAPRAIGGGHRSSNLPPGTARFWERTAQCMLQKTAEDSPPAEDAPVVDGALQRALTLHLAALRRPPARVTTLQLWELAAAWERCRPVVTPEMLDEVEEDLVRLASTARLRLEGRADAPLLLERVERRIAQAMLAETIRLADALRDRLQCGERLRLEDEWRDWMAVRLAYERLARVGGPNLGTLAWTSVHQALNLQGVRVKRPLDHEVFRWLAAEAAARHDAAALELETRNARVTSPKTRWAAQAGGLRLRLRSRWRAFAIFFCVVQLLRVTVNGLQTPRETGPPWTEMPGLPQAVSNREGSAVVGHIEHAGFFRGGSAHCAPEGAEQTKIHFGDRRRWGIQVKLMAVRDRRLVHVLREIEHPPFRDRDGHLCTVERTLSDVTINGWGITQSLWYFRPDMKFEWVPGCWTHRIYVDGHVVAEQAFDVR